jgi:hypothetical protein
LQVFPLLFQNVVWYQISSQGGKSFSPVDLAGDFLLQEDRFVVWLLIVKLKEKNTMRSHKRRRFWLWLGVVFLFTQGVAIGSIRAQAQGKPGIFFSQGQAIFDPQDRSKSQHEAVQNFLAQAITQAAATFLSPAQMGKQYPLIQEKILKQPDRYVLTYQLYSENPGLDGLYRVTGQVTVAMDTLKKDLMSLGLAHAEAETPQTEVLPLEPEGSVSNKALTKPGKAGEAAGETSTSRPEILWAVSEKWDHEWHMPGSRRDPEGLFAASVLQESQDYGWTIRLPQMGTLTPDPNGEVSPSQAVAQARALGLHYVAIGGVALVPEEGEENRLETTLRLLSVASGKEQVEIRKEWAVGNSSSQEAAIELANFVVPQIDGQLRETFQPSIHTETPATPEEAGELVLQIRSSDAYADWLTLEKTLREQFKNMEVKGLEIRPEEIIVRVSAVDATSLKNLNGTQLPDGVRLNIASVGADGHVFGVTVTKTEMSPAKPGQ